MVILSSILDKLSLKYPLLIQVEMSNRKLTTWIKSSGEPQIKSLDSLAYEGSESPEINDLP